MTEIVQVSLEPYADMFSKKFGMKRGEQGFLLELMKARVEWEMGVLLGNWDELAKEIGEKKGVRMDRLTKVIDRMEREPDILELTRLVACLGGADDFESLVVARETLREINMRLEAKR